MKMDVEHGGIFMNTEVTGTDPLSCSHLKVESNLQGTDTISLQERERLNLYQYKEYFTSTGNRPKISEI